MTFVLAAINPRLGAWQVTDQNITSNQQIVGLDWCKQVAVYAADASVLLSYNGLARTPRNVSMADWICETLCEGRRVPSGSRVSLPSVDSRSLDDYLEILTDRATRDFSYGPIKYRAFPLTISGIGFSNPGAIKFAVGNRYATGALRSTFAHVKEDLSPDSTAVMTAGSGADLLPRKVMQQVAEMLDGADGDLGKYMLPLHEVNKIVARRSQGLISEWSQVTCMQRSGKPLQARSFIDPGLRSSRFLSPVRIVSGGWDLTGTMMDTLEEFRTQNPGRQWFADEWIFGS